MKDMKPIIDISVHGVSIMVPESDTLAALKIEVIKIRHILLYDQIKFLY